MSPGTFELLRGKVRLHDEEGSYHPSIDTLLLAASADLKAGEHWWDVGCANGAVALCMMARCPDIRVTGLELNTSAAEEARRNAELNDRQRQFDVVIGDLADLPCDLRQISFDHIITNPPFFRKDASTVSPSPRRAEAHHAMSLSLTDWIRLCLKRLKPGGSLTLIHPGDQLGDVLTVLSEKCGRICVLPILTRAGQTHCKRVLVRAKLHAATPLQLLPALTVLKADGSYTDTMCNILEKAQPLNAVSAWPTSG